MNNKYKKFDGTGVITLTDDSEKSEILSKGQFSLQNRVFHAKPFLKGEELEQFKRNVYKRRIFVNYIPQHVTHGDLRTKFAKFGAIEDAYVIGEQLQSGYKSKGYGFVVFKLQDSAEKAVKAGTMQFNNASVKILPYSKRDTHPQQNSKGENQGQINSKKIEHQTTLRENFQEYSMIPNANLMPSLNTINSAARSSGYNSLKVQWPQKKSTYSEERAIRYKELFLCSKVIESSHKKNSSNLAICRVSSEKDNNQEALVLAR